MYLRLGKWIYDHRWLVVIVWAVLLVLSLPAVTLLPKALKSGGMTSDRLGSERARILLERELNFSPNSLTAIFTSDDLHVGDPAFEAEVDRFLGRVRGLPGLDRVLDHRQNPRQVSPDGRTAYEVLVLDSAFPNAQALVPQVQSAIQPGPVQVLISGAPVLYQDIQDVSERDLRRSEVLTFPIALAALIVVFGSLVAAGIPVAVGGASVAAALAVLYLIAQTTDLSIFVMNLATMLGLGLGTDYSLFLTSRFREELTRRDVPEAVAVTVATAGRAVSFSGLTVFIGLSGLISFDFMMLRSLGIGGALVVFFSVLAALTLLPAILGIVGQRVNALPLWHPRQSGGFWHGLATQVMRHPFRVFGAVLVLLLLLGVPFFRVRLSLPDAAVLPADVPSRQGYDLLNREFGPGGDPQIVLAVQSSGDMLAPENISALYDFTHRLRQDSRVSRVESVVDLDPRLSKAQYLLLYQDPARILDPYAALAATQLVKGPTAMVYVYSRYPSVEPEAKQLVHDIRQLDPGGGLTVLVDGPAAAVGDIVDVLYTDFPRAALLVVAVTYLVLLVLFRSVVLPLKAILMNALSILASYGALVVIFQEGFLARLLNFTPMGFVEATLPIITFCLLFGLSMDYEVFLLTRVKEAYDATGDNTRGVAEGLERSGKVITSAALLVVVVAASFVTADIILIKAVGLGTAIAVFLDATVVRALLVPATMRLLGDWNWWAPAPLRRLLPKWTYDE